MFPGTTYSKLRKTRSRRRKAKSRHNQLPKSTKTDRQTTQKTSLVSRFHGILNDLKRPGSRFSSYTIDELEPICQQIAIQVMSSTTPITDCCPFVCIFCQNFIYEPITLYCGHTFCNQCIQNEESTSSTNCPRCPENIQGQIQSSIVHARDRSYKKNRFLTELFENSETLKIKCQMISLCHQGQKEYSNGDYQKAIEIYSQIIDQSKRRIFLFCFLMNFILYLIDNDDHLALYNRAKAYKALKQHDQALTDATHVVTLRSQWAKVRFQF
jgi:tetratricopeptide (TPR) repeat protein